MLEYLLINFLFFFEKNEKMCLIYIILIYLKIFEEYIFYIRFLIFFYVNCVEYNIRFLFLFILNLFRG